MNAECERHQLALVDGIVSEHVRSCDDCAAFHAVARRLEPPDGLVLRALERLSPLLAARAAERRALVWRLALAGAFSLPVMLALNAGMLWMTHAALVRVASPAIAMIGTGLVGASLLLSLSIAYGSLPLLATWGHRIRERTT